MSDQEKYEQVGRLAEEVSKLRGDLNHVNEKLNRAFFAYSKMGNSSNPANWTLKGDGQNQSIQLVVTTNYSNSQQIQNADLSALLNQHEIIKLLEQRDKLTKELNSTTERLRGLAPNLL